MQAIKEIMIAVILIIGFIIMCYVIKGYEVLSTTRSIESEQRDSLNVQNCYIMNNNNADFKNCLYSN